jgi:hypothetical protein
MSKQSKPLNIRIGDHIRDTFNGELGTVINAKNNYDDTYTYAVYVSFYGDTRRLETDKDLQDAGRYEVV